MKKKANFIKFWANFRRICGNGNKRTLEYCHRQYKLLTEGVRDVRISDTGIYAWNEADGEW